MAGMKSSDPREEALRRLGLPPAATWRQVESRYRQLALSLHPDVSPAPAAAQRFRQVTAAYRRLTALRQERQAGGQEELARLAEDPRIRSLPPQELTLRLRHSSSAQVRAAAAVLLARTGGKEVRQSLVAALRDPEQSVRASAMEALGRVGRLVDLPALLAAAVRGAAARSACRGAAGILRRSLGK
jgi:curved DNA-binding protein CbpA